MTRSQAPMRAILLATLAAAAAVAGCTTAPPAGDVGHGAVYTAFVTDGAGCTVRLPFPTVDGAAWDVPLETAAATTATTVATAYGVHLEVTGDGLLSANATWTGPEPTPARLGGQQAPFEPQADGFDRGTFWVRASGCAGSNVTLAWAFDDASGVAYRILLRGQLPDVASSDGWRQVVATREVLRA